MNVCMLSPTVVAGLSNKEHPKYTVEVVAPTVSPGSRVMKQVHYKSKCNA